MPTSARPSCLLLLLLSLLPHSLDGADAIGGQKGERFSVVDTTHLRVYIPRGLEQHLVPVAHRADQLFALMCAAARYQPKQRLGVIFDHRSGLHNGWSMQIPMPLVSIDLAAPPPESPLFAGPLHLERTLIHEFAHHISNDRNHGLRGLGERLFGRVLPEDSLSLLVYLLTTPAHHTMPTLWHEGLAQWAESAYLGPDTAWGGRGRDSLVHMIWRLDAADQAIPPVHTWRLSHVTWPYGRRAYDYGLVYMRHLVQATGVDPWRLVDDQARQKPFMFTDGSTATTGHDHGVLLERARVTLQREQEAQLERLRAVPWRTGTRLSPPDARLGAPAWLDDQRLMTALNERHRKPRLAIIDRDGRVRRTRHAGHGSWPLRRVGEGAVVAHRLDANLALSSVLHDAEGRRHHLGAVFHVDGRHDPDGWSWVAVRHRPEGDQQLVTATGHDPLTGAPTWQLLPAHDQVWSPAMRPGHDDIAWIEASAEEARLVIGNRRGQRRVLLQMAARIIHPTWSPDGRHLYIASDISGVANAYRVDPDDGSLSPLTHSPGGVIACVPSPDGRHLAIVDHDRRGPFLAIIPADAEPLPNLPGIALDFPAVHGVALPPPPPADHDTVSAPRPYRGLTALRLRYWTPTTMVVPEGGLGITAVAIDPLLTHHIQAGVGIGPNEEREVGRLMWSYRGWPLQLAAIAQRSERRHLDQRFLPMGGGREDFIETVDEGTVRLGYGVSGLERRWFAFLSATVGEHRAVSDTLTVGPRPAFEGRTQSIGLHLGYDHRTMFADGFAMNDGLAGSLSLRRSGFGGELARDQAFATLQYALPVWRGGGHQLVFGAQVGWSDGDEILQHSFTIGGPRRSGYPRGYGSEWDTGPYFAGYGLSYRLPLARPFRGIGTSPLVKRQVFADVFYEGGRLWQDRLFGDRGVWGPSRWFRSYGVMVHSEWEFNGLRLQPAIGVVRQVDGAGNTNVIWQLGMDF